VAKPTLETPGPGPSAQQRMLEKLTDAVEAQQRLETSMAVIRGHIERRGTARPVGVRVVACLLDLAVMQQALLQLQIVALGEMTE